MKFIALDLETTGLDPETDAIIEIAAIKFEDGEIIDSFQTLINPGRRIPTIVTQITNITDEMVVDAEAFEIHKKSVEEFIGDLPILGQNIQFDISFLRNAGIKLENLELDTFVLARAIIPNAESYSLEVLTKNLEIDHSSAHRAYDDALASVKLMEKLRLLLLKENSEVLTPITNFLGTQTWSWREFLLQSIEEKDKYKDDLSKLSISSIPESEHGAPHEELDFSTHEVPLKGKKITEGFIDPEKYNFPEKTLVALPGNRTYYFPKKSFKLKYNYLLPERFEALLEKNIKWKEEDIATIIKLIIWFSKTKTCEISELSIYNKEFRILNRINLKENESHEIYDRKLQELEKGNKIYISHTNLLKIINLDLPLNIDVKNLLILDALDFEKSLARNMTTSIGVGDTDDEGEMLFGLLGILFEKFAPANLSFPEIEITEEIQTSEDWARCTATAKSMLETFKEDLSPKLKLLEEVLTAPEKFKLFLLHMNVGDLLLRITPKDIRGLLEKRLWNKFENIIVNDDIIESGSDAFLKRALDLAEFEIKKITTAIPPTFKSFPDLPPVKDRSFTENAVKKIATIAKDHTHTLVIFPSNGSISHFINKLTPHLEENEKPILGQGVSGSSGKIISKISNTGNILFINFEFALELIEIFKDRDFNDFALIFPRLPFMHPENPYMKYIETFYKDGYTAYKQYSMPKARCRTLKLASRYAHTFDDTANFILDSRMG
ncbi:hypothetical protein HOG48_06560 [Candidatus Peregrinibacteria bacterium]|jgi:DNA polymerase III epsilon subunit family exonuclease|nr:hypothetical protein [Candidatus Peregrinibacteria bacterium]